MAMLVVGYLLFAFVLKGDDGPGPASTTPAAGGDTATGQATAAGVPSDEATLTNNVSAVVASAETPMISTMEERMLQIADVKWHTTPFFQSKPGDIAEEANATFVESADLERFEVSGVFMLGPEDKVAIINGWDFRVGDEILPATPGYYVTEITPESVSIGRRDDRSGEIVTVLTKQLEEDDPFQIRDTQQ
ncbi:MAG: hypothetical protein D6E12_04170 [Desulfovibrio sp.]|nr:MAG: hypothetical protein D6E12_04170 [Desulfovibrio sp.]